MVKLATTTNAEAATSDIENIAWAALEKVAQKQKRASDLPEGSQHSIELSITGSVNGAEFEKNFSSLLSIGHSQTKASSVNPQMPELIAWILSKLNRATRNRLLTDIPEEFVQNGSKLPESNEVLAHEAEQLLQRLRRTKTVHARGAVRCEYKI